LSRLTKISVQCSERQVQPHGQLQVRSVIRGKPVPFCKRSYRVKPGQTELRIQQYVE